MRRERRKKGCIRRILTYIMYFFAAMIVITLISETIGSNSGDTSSRPAGVEASVPDVPSTPEATSIPEVTPTHAPEATPMPTPKDTPTPAPAETPTPAPEYTPEPETLQEWAEYVANSVYGSFDPKYSSLISVECEQVDGENAPMIIINAKYPDTFMRDNDERMGSFLYNAMKTTWKLNDLAKEGKIEYGSVFIHGRTTFLDKYGNETEGDAASIRIKAREAAKVNWSLTTFRAEMMPGIAVSFMIHPIIRDGISAEYLNEIRK